MSAGFMYAATGGSLRMTSASKSAHALRRAAPASPLATATRDANFVPWNSSTSEPAGSAYQLLQGSQATSQGSRGVVSFWSRVDRSKYLTLTSIPSRLRLDANTWAVDAPKGKFTV